MSRPKLSFRDRVRAAVSAGGDEPATVAGICEQLKINRPEKKRRIRTELAKLKAAGEIEHVGPSTYRRAGRPPKTPAKKPTVNEAMWRVVRARRRVTIDDLRELTGASQSAAAKFLQTCVRQGVCNKRDKFTFQMVSDPVVCPVNEKATEYQRKIRAAKKRAMAAMDQAFSEIADARMAINDIEEPQPDEMSQEEK